MTNMNCFSNLYKQYYHLQDCCKSLPADNGSTNLLQYGITKEYFSEMSKAAGLLRNFYDKYLANDRVAKTLAERIGDEHIENVKFALIIDVLRCYDALDHPTSFTTPEGIALMVFLGDMLGFGQIKSYEQLGEVKPATLSLLDITPYASACSEALGKSYSLFVPLLLEHEAPEVDKLYRMLMRNFCEAIAKDDGVITLSESEWLNEIAPQTDGAQNNGQGN